MAYARRRIALQKEDASLENDAAQGRAIAAIGKLPYLRARPLLDLLLREETQGKSRLGTAGIESVEPYCAKSKCPLARW